MASTFEIGPCPSSLDKRGDAATTDEPSEAPGAATLMAAAAMTEGGVPPHNAGAVTLLAAGFLWLARP